MESTAPYRGLQSGEMLNWYRIERILGRGGFGVIYLATDTNLDHQVAIKEYIPVDIAERVEGDSHVVPRGEANRDLFHWGLKRFIREARNLVKFKHPNIVRVISIFQQNNTAYMVMEFEEGEDLKRHLRRMGDIPEALLKDLVVPISEGLTEVHRHGFIHRDIKPSNILVRRDGSPVLLDFGSARNAKGSGEQALTALVSAGYAPLEQYDAESDEQQGPWTDVYALAGVLYFAVTGHAPADSTRRCSAIVNGGQDPLIPASRLADGRYTQAFLKAIDWGMQFRIADRPQSVNDWIPALLSSATPPDAAETTQRLLDRHQRHQADPVTQRTGRTAAPRTARPATSQPLNNDTLPPLRSVEPTLAEHTGRRSQTRPPSSRRARQRSVKRIQRSILAGILLLGGWWAVDEWRDRQERRAGTLRVTAEPVAPQSEEVAPVADMAEVAAPATAEPDDISRPETASVDLTSTIPADNPSADTPVSMNSAEVVKRDARAAEKAATDALVKQAIDRAATDRLAPANPTSDEPKTEETATEEVNGGANIDVQADSAPSAPAPAQSAEDLARKALNRSLIRGQRALAIGDIAGAQRELDTANSLSLADARLDEFRTIFSEAVAQEVRAVSDADFNLVASKFNELKQAIEARDIDRVRVLTIGSDQIALFERLMQRFAQINVDVDSIRVRNADKAIIGVLRIESMVRENGDRATPSDAYRERRIASRRLRGDWSQIEW